MKNLQIFEKKAGTVQIWGNPSGKWGDGRIKYWWVQWYLTKETEPDKIAADVKAKVDLIKKQYGFDKFMKDYYEDIE